MAEIVTYRRVADFLDRAEDWLLRKEAENNLILGVAGRIASEASDRNEYLFLTVEENGNVAGCAFRTPPWKLVVTECPAQAIDGLVDLVHRRYPDLAAVLGPNPAARSFAAAWARRYELTFRPGMRQRVYELDTVIRPDPAAEGTSRVADKKEKTLLVEWLVAFHQEVGFPLDDPEGSAARLLEDGEAWFWCNPEPVSLAVCTGHTRNGVRIGLVFTPVEQRGHGYASEITAALAQNALDRGKQTCFLFTDVDNPTSNKIYRSIGFRPVTDMIDYLFEPQR